MELTPMYYYKIAISIYRVENIGFLPLFLFIEKNSNLYFRDENRDELETWSDFASKYYYIDKNRSGLKML